MDYVQGTKFDQLITLLEENNELIKENNELLKTLIVKSFPEMAKKS